MKISFRIEVLILFSILEIALFNRLSQAQLGLTVIEYLFITYAVIVDRKVGLMYFISFTLLAIGEFSYGGNSDIIVNNFYGLRVFNLSFNIAYSAFLFFFILILGKGRYSLVLSNPNNKFFAFFILYSIAIGLIYITLSINSFDDYYRDTLNYAPFFIYVYLIAFLDQKAIESILKYGILVTVLSMVYSFLTSTLFDYAYGHSFVIINAYGYIIPIFLLLFNRYFTKKQFIFSIIIIGYLVITSNLFISGKLIIIFIILGFWLIFKSIKHPIIIVPSIIIILFYANIMFVYLIDYFWGNTISNKFSQVYISFIHFDIHEIATYHTSIGNIAGEGITIFSYMLNNIEVFFFGKGFGGGVPDLFGYLSPWAGKGGYSVAAAYHNNFYRMHLPIYDIFIKSGIFGLGFYIVLLIRSFIAKSNVSFIYFILLFAFFYISKEMLLLTLLFMKLSEYIILNKKLSNIY